MAARFTSCIGERIALCHQPSSKMEDVGFRSLIQLVFSNYTMHSCTTFNRYMVHSLFQACRDRVKGGTVDKEGHAVHFTSDFWRRDRGQHSYFSHTAHWWQLEEAERSGKSSSVVATYRCALNHAKILNIMHTLANILEAKGCMVTAIAANVFKTGKDGEFVGIHCNAHINHPSYREDTRVPHTQCCLWTDRAGQMDHKALQWKCEGKHATEGKAFIWEGKQQASPHPGCQHEVELHHPKKYKKLSPNICKTSLRNQKWTVLGLLFHSALMVRAERQIIHWVKKCTSGLIFLFLCWLKKSDVIYLSCPAPLDKRQRGSRSS